MTRGQTSRPDACPGCGEVPLDPDAARRCPRCGQAGVVRAEPASVGGISLLLRSLALVALPRVHGLGVGLGTLAMLTAGGVIPVLRAWLDDEIRDRMDVVTRLGGVRVTLPDHEMDVSFGPVLKRGDAPLFYHLLGSLSRRMGVRPPDEVRLAFLPCCGVLSRRGRRILLMGMPLLHVLTRGELQAILAHEMAHLARGDATRVMEAFRFVEALARALDGPQRTAWGPLRAWAQTCRWAGEAVSWPVTRGQEARADRVSAAVAGGGVAASALAKVAMVQPLFREVLARFAPDRPNVFASFRALWDRLPDALRDEMRRGLLAERSGLRGDPHPPLADRLHALQAASDRPEVASDLLPAWGLVNDPEWLEEMLQESLFRHEAVRPTIFHRAGS